MFPLHCLNRSGLIKNIQAHTVHENDEFFYNYGLKAELFHKPALYNRGKITHYYAMFQTITDGFNFVVMSVQEVEEFAQKYSKSYEESYSPWQSNFDEMAKKTVLKNCLKYAPLKTEFTSVLNLQKKMFSTITDVQKNTEDFPYIAFTYGILVNFKEKRDGYELPETD